MARHARTGWIAPLLAVSLAALSGAGCDARESATQVGPTVPPSSDPEGKDLVAGAIVAAFEPDGGVRLYKVKEVRFFPKPVGDELVMIAFREKGNDFVHAAKLFQQRKLTVIVPNVRVSLHNFIERNYRVLEVEPVTDAERKLDRDDAFPALVQPALPPSAEAG